MGIRTWAMPVRGGSRTTLGMVARVCGVKVLGTARRRRIGSHRSSPPIGRPRAAPAQSMNRRTKHRVGGWVCVAVMVALLRVGVLRVSGARARAPVALVGPRSRGSLKPDEGQKGCWAILHFALSPNVVPVERLVFALSPNVVSVRHSK